MEPGAWVALAGLGFTVIVTVVGTVMRAVRRIIDEFDKHEEKDEVRYQDTIQRITRLETLVINGSGSSYYTRNIK